MHVVVDEQRAVTLVHSGRDDGVGEIVELAVRRGGTALGVLVVDVLSGREQRIAAPTTTRLPAGSTNTRVKRWSAPSRLIAVIVVSSFSVEAGVSARSVPMRARDPAGPSTATHALPAGATTSFSAFVRAKVARACASLWILRTSSVGTRRADQSGRAGDGRGWTVPASLGPDPGEQEDCTGGRRNRREHEARELASGHVTAVCARAGNARRARDGRARSPRGSRSSSTRVPSLGPLPARDCRAPRPRARWR